MEYFGVRWLHSADEDPVVLWHEIGDDRLEIRKVHEFRDGSRERTDKVEPEKRTSLGWVPVPYQDEIRAQDEFDVFALASQEFDEVWNSAVDA